MPCEEMILSLVQKRNGHHKAYHERQTLYVWIRIPASAQTKFWESRDAGIVFLLIKQNIYIYIDFEKKSHLGVDFLKKMCIIIYRIHPFGG